MKSATRSCLAVLILGSFTHVVRADEPALAGAPRSGVLTLRSGSSVVGRLESFETGEFVRWQGDAFTGPFEFPTGEIASIAYAPADPRVELKGEFALELSGGDLLSGRIVSWTGGKMSLDSPQFGNISLKERTVRRLYRIDDNPGLLLSGLTGLTDWKTVDGKWKTDGTQLWTDQPEAALKGDFGIPEKAVVEFEISWKKTPNFRFAIGVDPDAKSDAASGWSFETWGSTLALVRERPDIAAVEQIQSLDGDVTRIRLIAFLDQPARTIHVYRPDGGPVTKMTLPAPEKPLTAGAASAKQTGIALINQAGEVRLERLRIARWNGNLPLTSDSESSRFELKSGEVISGQMIAFDPSSQMITVRDDAETRTFSLKDVNAAEFIGAGLPASSPLIAALHDQTRISGELLRVTDQSVVIKSPDVNEPIDIAREAIRSIAVSGGSKQNGGASLTAYSGRLELGSHRLQGRLIPGEVTEDASCLVWHPEFSRIASPLKPAVSGRIVYRERRTPAQPVQRRQVQPPPKNVFEKFGELFLKNLDNPAPGKNPAVGEPHDVHLLTGDVVPCLIESIDQFGVRIKSTTAEVDMIPHDKIKAVVFDRAAAAPQLEKAKKERLLTLPRNQKSSPPTHLLYSTTGDFLRCRVNSLDGDVLKIELHLAEIDLPRERVTHVIWLHPETLIRSIADAPDSSAEPESEPPPVAGPQLHQTQVILSNGNRSTFLPREVTDETISGVSDVIGGLKYRLASVDMIVFGNDIQVAAADLAYHQWALQPAILPRFLQEGDDGPSGGDGMVSNWVGKPAPDFRLDLLDGGSFTLSEAKGKKVIVLDFWATWCGPCMMSMPLMEEAMQAFDAEKVQLISVNLEEQPQQIRDVLTRHKLSPTVALDIDGAIARRYEIDAIPQLFVVDIEGNIARHFIGGGQSAVDQFSESMKAMLEPPINE